MQVRPIKTRVFKEGENLADFIITHIPKLKNGSILAVTSKIAALAEGRVAILKNRKEKERLIRSESEWQLKVLPQWWLTVRDGTVVVNAGLDNSNADGKTILLPKDSFTSALALRKQLKKKYKLKNLGVVITDSRTSALRAGVTGVALGYAGFKGIKDYRGQADIFGRKLKVTQTNVADSLATVATIVMGEGSERQPLAIIEDAPIEFSEKVNRKELRISLKYDMYRSLFAKKMKIKGSP
ncbi:MAG: coenzyme F420-0:L-glutamate ligase [bacterium]|nr:coenzyme F420-0:L-glutamate ligase [bacterium]